MFLMRHRRSTLELPQTLRACVHVHADSMGMTSHFTFGEYISRNLLTPFHATSWVSFASHPPHPRRLWSPFNIGNYLLIALTLAPGLGLLAAHKHLSER